MTVADKKRILSAATVQGELLIQVKGSTKKRRYRFSCHNTRNTGENACVMLHLHNTYVRDCFVNCKKYTVEFWVPGIGTGHKSEFIQRFQYCEITILWAMYKGIEQKQAA